MQKRRSSQLFFYLLVAGIQTLIFTACSPGTRIARTQPIDTSSKLGSPQWNQHLATSLNAPWVHGNQVITLMNGDAFFPSMLDAMRKAKKSITFEIYAFTEGTMAQRFVNVFCERARHGVKVHIILDSAGSIDIGETNIKRLNRAGAQLVFYHPYKLFHSWQYNTRDHRKIMVIDGKIAFTGGCGIADAWMGNAKSSKEWRENHYRITGPIVRQIQQAFVKNWKYTGGKTLSGPEYSPPLHPTGTLLAQAFISSPKEKIYTVPFLYRQVIASAKKSIVIQNSYFIPDHAVLKEIIKARKRGVRIDLIVPGSKTDAWLVRCLAHGYHQKLIRAGVHIYEYKKTMMHCKLLVVDGIFTSIGSANFDPRSLYINDEFNVNILNKTFAQEQLKMIEQDKKKSPALTEPPAWWNPFTLPKRMLAQILAPQL